MDMKSILDAVQGLKASKGAISRKEVLAIIRAHTPKHTTWTVVDVENDKVSEKAAQVLEAADALIWEDTKLGEHIYNIDDVCDYLDSDPEDGKPIGKGIRNFFEKLQKIAQASHTNYIRIIDRF